MEVSGGPNQGCKADVQNVADLVLEFPPGYLGLYGGLALF
jgi:hypothetical protein